MEADFFHGPQSFSVAVPFRQLHAPRRRLFVAPGPCACALVHRHPQQKHDVEAKVLLGRVHPHGQSRGPHHGRPHAPASAAAAHPPPRHDPGAAGTDGREAARWLHRGGPRRGGGGQPRGARARWIRGRCPRASAGVGSAVYAHDRAVSAAAAAGPASSSGTTAMAKAAAASEGAGRAEGAAEGMRRTPESRSEKRAAHAARNCSTIGRQEPGINPAGKLAPYAAAEGGGGGRPSKPGGLPLRLQGVAREVRGGGQQRR
jgi:hypothetical protein